ncbi:MAG: protein translocase SEC61 complex subunit gamma [Candidatus Micrarchaeia archaeon]
MLFGIDRYMQRALRVLNVSYRPKRKEFEMIVKVTGLGMIVIGLIGFVITIIFTVLDSFIV